jgi:D-alanyl-D-alanine carboxypeptidase (penicillin-binding protein 5/6)
LTRARVWKGATQQLELGLTEDLYLTLPRGRYDQLKATLELPQQITAPITRGQAHGKVDLALGGDPVASLPLVALESVPEGSLWQRLGDTVRLWFE